MNRDQKLLEEAYQSIYESSSDDIPQEVKDYILDKGRRGDLNLDSQLYPNLTSLPDNLEVRGNLYMRNSSIKALPKNLHVHGNLGLHGADITTLPSDIKVGGYLDLSRSKITSLPDNLEVGGSLHLTGTYIDKLPSGLKVGYYLFLTNCPIKRVQDLPLDLEVHGKIESIYFTSKEAKDYLRKIKKLNKKLSKDFDISALEDF